MVYDIIYGDKNLKIVRIQPVKPYKFEELKKGMYVYYSKLQRNFKITGVIRSNKSLFLEGHYGSVKYEYDIFYPYMQNDWGEE